MISSTTLLNNKTTPKSYPKLMRGYTTHCIILFSSHTVGMVVKQGDSSNPIGHFRDNWNINGYSDYNKSVVLVNK